MPNGVKKLSYPAYGAGGVDPRLGMAHTHANAEVLDKITSDTLDDITNAAVKDLSNVSMDDFNAKLSNSDCKAVLEVGDNSYYIRTKGGWVKLSIAQEFPSIVSGDSSALTIKTENGGRKVTIQLTNDFVTKINSVVNKMNKLSSSKNGNLVAADGTGNVKDTGISKSSLLLASDLVTDAAQVDPATSDKKPLSASAGNKLYKQLIALKQGVGRPRGSVVNAFVSTGNGIQIEAAWVGFEEFAGKGYKQGSLAYITTLSDNTLIPALVKINEVNADGSLPVNTQSALTVISGGVFIHNVTNWYRLIPCESNTDDYATIANGVTNVPYTTLRSIESPQDGDTAYVMKDETDNGSHSIYMYQVPNENEGIGTWVKVSSFDSADARYILRYE